MLAERPGDPTALNTHCWYKAAWNFQTDDLADVCTKAVEQANWAPPVLDSRAMAYYRLGRYEDALRDLNAALSSSPELTPSLFMRGIVRQAMGDPAGESDVREALSRQPSLAPSYARYGIKVN